jgi:hypothetical protein
MKQIVLDSGGSKNVFLSPFGFAFLLHFVSYYVILLISIHCHLRSSSYTRALADVLTWDMETCNWTGICVGSPHVCSVFLSLSMLLLGAQERTLEQVRLVRRGGRSYVAL